MAVLTIKNLWIFFFFSVHATLRLCFETFIAGLRLLDENTTRSIIHGVDAALSDVNVSPFLYDDEYVRILSGEEEALFAWITVNYLKHFFDDRFVYLCFTHAWVLPPIALYRYRYENNVKKKKKKKKKRNTHALHFSKGESIHFQVG